MSAEPRNKGDGTDGEGIGFVGAGRGSFDNNPPCEGGEELKGTSLKISYLSKGREVRLGPLNGCTGRASIVHRSVGQRERARRRGQASDGRGFDVVRNEGRMPLET
jgi:hypothetical protein